MTQEAEPLTTSDLAGDAQLADSAPQAPVQTPGSSAPDAPTRDDAATTGQVEAPPAAPGGGAGPGAMALLGDEESGEYRNRWQQVQGTFVDEPRAAVEKADALVAELMQHLARRFAEERGQLETQWTSGGEVGTEELRVALQRYRSFFQRLLER